MIKIAPSILAADPINLERDVRRVAVAGCDWLHIDVMDAHFVPNLAYTPDVVRRLKETFGQLPLDVHLMMDCPENMVYTFLDAGADVLTIHAEIGDKSERILGEIRKAGVHPGIAVKPGTPLSSIEGLAEQADLVLMMTVEPGFGGQTLDERVIGKISNLRKLGYKGWIEADGGIREDNLEKLIRNGLDIAVMGTALFRCEDVKSMIERLHAIS